MPGGIFETLSRGQVCETERLGQDHAAMQCCVLAMARDKEIQVQKLPSLFLVVTLLLASSSVSLEGDLGQGPRNPVMFQGQTWITGGSP